jgi:hypothetical protein
MEDALECHMKWIQEDLELMEIALKSYRSYKKSGMVADTKLLDLTVKSLCKQAGKVREFWNIERAQS